MPHIVVVTTGGTISTRDTDGRGARPALRGADLLREIPGLDAVATVEVEEFAFVPGAHVTLAMIRDLADRVAALAARPGTDGIVVTHGTDTLEETAYYLHLTVPGEVPVVFTGAMRNASQIGFDGYRNLYDAIRTAAAPGARGRGVLVVLNEEVHSARWVTKTNGQKEDTYRSPVTGPAGLCYGDRIAFVTAPVPRRVLPNRLEPAVDLIRLAVDADDRFIRCSLASGARGIVLEAFGGGRVPPALLPAIDQAIAGGVAVVATTRCHAGAMWDAYGYEGAFRDLQRRGVAFVHDLPGHKARLRLAVGLGNGLRGEALRDYLADDLF
ncbi:MAG: asparaginase [Armatimonadota bacterium]|nr:asparaginase [Armatimonadota bacterium]MDR7453858.1 asparaginase [Armatimonadota bacterium]MDR7457985.1 asparaginase [Armatimonadota bacterium]MDR7495697.1 asparaginase [Armatimonadota bacterium]MDR7511057.1 asparaginase [Armatimonadota bacterium]